MPGDFKYDVFLSHSAKDKPVIRPLVERLRADGLNVWFDEWQIKPGDSIPSKIEEGLEHSRVLVLCMSDHAFGSDWAQLETGTFRFRDPLNKDRRFIPLRLDDAPIKGSLAQFMYINWHPNSHEQEYPRFLSACRHLGVGKQADKAEAKSASENRRSERSAENNLEAIKSLRNITSARRSEWERIKADFEAEAKKYPRLKLKIHFVRPNGPFPDYDRPNHMINLWQFYGGGGEARNRLASAEITKFGIMGAEVTAYGVLLGSETELFCRMANRAGSLLPDDIDNVVLKNVRETYSQPSDASIVVANRNPLAKWLNLVMMTTVNSCPERFEVDTLAVDPFAASLMAFDLFSEQL